MLVAFRRQHPAAIVELRLDANGAWRSVDEALERLEQLAAIDPLFVEQPLPAGRWQEMAALCAASPVPIALDEELIAASTADRRATLLRTIRPQHVILKPSLLGGLAACETWIAEAQQLGVQWWINSLLESNVGLNAIAQWTATLGVTAAQGLGTGRVFTNNIPSPLHVDAGALHLLPERAWDLAPLLTKKA